MRTDSGNAVTLIVTQIINSNRGVTVGELCRQTGMLADDAASSEVLRWHPGERAMVALFRNIVTDEPQAISRTFLDHEARKDVARAPGGRKFLGPVKGAAIARRASHRRRHRDVHGGANAWPQTHMGTRQCGRDRGAQLSQARRPHKRRRKAAS
jgi:hypothetical protein